LLMPVNKCKLKKQPSNTSPLTQSKRRLSCEQPRFYFSSQKHHILYFFLS
jgi:hypothetical protein